MSNIDHGELNLSGLDQDDCPHEDKMWGESLESKYREKYFCTKCGKVFKERSKARYRG